MGIVQTITDVVTDNKRYYRCPKCGREVWAYGVYQGNICENCSGTFAHGLLKTLDNISPGITTRLDIMCDLRSKYRCPNCGKWCYGTGNLVGSPCCFRKWFNMNVASDYACSLEQFLANYDSDGSITLDGHRFENIIPQNCLRRAKDYMIVHTKWGCGNNAINICLKIHGYSKQLYSSDYEHNPIGCGWSWENFYELNIKPNFEYCGWRGHETVAEQVEYNWDYIDGTNYKNYSLIIMGGQDICAHYTIVLGVSTDKKYYIVTDQKLQIWLVDLSLFKMISVYKATRHINLYQQHSLYRVG
ncbi:hypothetical protein TVAGG3_0734510 [Trichomonas vaginalis G3]|uniref:hypothetical protein n=1 Tax=Trichomonas vaginalis (strain ATCC PRA-98 / G3) TaxID=412133 RepID=UPI0021E5CBEC|nr:hypothetical protein TVAGG3_0734510 [Trichomonas vaginalis G3]KAI5511485.1 hypothetical protein TVAGG3_0734510 [Trichomonas vaginalis G3]